MKHLDSALLHSLWQGPLLALAIFGVSRFVSRPADRHRLFFGALVLTALLPFATLLLFQVPRKADKGQVMAMLRDGIPLSSEAGSILPALYFGLAGLGLALFFVAWLYTKRTFGRQAAGAPEWLDGVAREEAAKLGLRRFVALKVCDAGTSPATTGFREPMIVLPSSLLNLPESELRSLVAHELAHIQRRDYFLALIQSVVSAVAFYQPTIWLLNRWIRDERERACDDLVVERTANPVDYALALARIEFGKANRPMAILNASGGRVSSRIARLGRARSSKAAPRGLLTGALLLGALLCCTGFFFRPIGSFTFVASGKVRLQSAPKFILFNEGKNPPVEKTRGQPLVRMLVVKELSANDRAELAKLLPE